MKIALIFKGPLRCGIDKAWSNYRDLLGNFSNLSIVDIDSYFFSHASSEANDFAYKYSGAFDSICLTKRLPDEEVLKLLTTKNQCCIKYPTAIFPASTYRLFWMNKFILDFVAAQNIKYDYIVLSRTEVSIKFKDLNEWFDPNFYCTNEPSIYPFPKDCIGIATPEIIYKAWDYKNLETLNRLNAESENTENLLCKIMELNGVEYKSCQTDHFEITK